MLEDPDHSTRWMSCVHAAEALGLPAEEVALAALDRRLDAIFCGHRYYVRLTDVARWAGRPRIYDEAPNT